MERSEEKLYKRAYWLSLFTIGYNIIEGLVSMFLGYQDETLALFGFGADSFIEVMSGIGIAVMILRIQQNPDSPKSGFENRGPENNRNRILSAFCRFTDGYRF
ncbi:MAG: hypothetical protein AB2L24_04735 [Mangrovibacterium sp.]